MTVDMAADEDETDRAAVTTYVPAYQRDAWDEHADELDMSRSEFVRSMVQAGRKGFNPGGWTEETDSNGSEESQAESSPDHDLEATVREALEEGPRSWDDLLQAVTGDIETRLENALDSLQAADEVRYSGREGGYILVT